MTIDDAYRDLRRVGVFGFGSRPAALLTYAGSTAWFLVLVGAQGVALATDNLAHDEVLYGATIASTTLSFVLQTVDVLTYRQAFWPLTSMNWCTQLGGIGLAAAGVGRALEHPEQGRVVVCVLLLYAQCLFTASQFAVTLDYLHRAATDAYAHRVLHQSVVPRLRRSTTSAHWRRQ